ncbi:MAG: GNAT family N-acetyltransferase [Lysobacter sp.]|nr:GNAT family N-acetyltransferase [Lysobacter sp.]
MHAIAEMNAAAQLEPADESPAGLSLSTLWDALASAQWSLRAQQRWLPEVLARAHELVPESRIAWLLRLREASHSAWAAPASVRQTMLQLASAWCDWPLLLTSCERMDAAGELPAWAGSLMATAQLRLGESQAALSRCRAMALLDPQDRWATGMHDALQQWIAFVERAPPIPGDGLRLEPLGHHHAQDFANQYFDPAIAERCCLPTFADHAHWHRWLDQCWGYGDQRLYAVIHAEWGFVGSVSLILHDDIGLFYYWLGRDFQGHGLGPAAAQLLLEDARVQRRMRTCYAKVFEYNTPSRRALEKLGFDALDFRPAPPNADEMLYRRGPAQTRQGSVEELRALFVRMGLDTRIAVPLPEAPTTRSMRFDR